MDMEYQNSCFFFFSLFPHKRSSRAFHQDHHVYWYASIETLLANGHIMVPLSSLHSIAVDQPTTAPINALSKKPRERNGAL